MAEANQPLEKAPLRSKDYASSQMVRWCPGCGDYAILSQFQSALAILEIPKEKVAIISGIGCSSRFPYYMNTYGVHSIHGRATAFATGLRLTRPDLSIWVVTGDGDGLAIGGNHMLHLLRRNLDINVLLFNNQIYGLTKGQYSPTSQPGLKTKTSPSGLSDYPLNPLAFALGAGASFVARGIDRDSKHLRNLIIASHQHKGTAFLEIYQNCNIFNDGAFSLFTGKETKLDHTILLESGQPLIFGSEKQYGILLDGHLPKRVDLNNRQYSIDDLWIHDEKDIYKAQILARFFDAPGEMTDTSFPRPFGIIYQEAKPCYQDLQEFHSKETMESQSEKDIQELLKGKSSWIVE